MRNVYIEAKHIYILLMPSLSVVNNRLCILPFDEYFYNLLSVRLLDAFETDLYQHIPITSKTVYINEKINEILKDYMHYIYTFNIGSINFNNITGELTLKLYVHLITKADVHTIDNNTLIYNITIPTYHYD